MGCLVAAVSSFLLGGLGYSKGFLGKAWNMANGSMPQSAHPGKVFGVSFAFALVAAVILGLWH